MSIAESPVQNESAGAAAVAPDARASFPITISFYSYFKELTGCETAVEEVSPGTDVGTLLRQIFARFPRVAAMDHSMLVAVGLEYQRRSYQLQPGNEVALFPPVQGG